MESEAKAPRSLDERSNFSLTVVLVRATQMEPILIAAILFGALLIVLSIVGSFYVYRYTMNRDRIHEKTGSVGRSSIVACEEGKIEARKRSMANKPSINLPGQIPEGGIRKQRSEPSDPPSSALNALNAHHDPGVRRKSSAALYEMELLGIGALPVDVQSAQEELERQKRKNMMVV